MLCLCCSNVVLVHLQHTTLCSGLFNLNNVLMPVACDESHPCCVMAAVQIYSSIHLVVCDGSGSEGPTNTVVLRSGDVIGFPTKALPALVSSIPILSSTMNGQCCHGFPLSCHLLTFPNIKIAAHESNRGYHMWNVSLQSSRT